MPRRLLTLVPRSRPQKPGPRRRALTGSVDLSDKSGLPAVRPCGGQGWYRGDPACRGALRGIPQGARGGRRTMTEFPRGQDVRGVVAGFGGEEAIIEARNRNQSYIDGHRLAERRKASGLAQAQAAERMGVTKSRVSQIERGEVSMRRALPAVGR